MKSKVRKLYAVAVIFFATAAAALAQAPSHDMKSMTQQMGEKMTSMPMTGNADIDFARMMRQHHLGGIDMARWEAEHGKDPKMKEMARHIVASQEKDVRNFYKWLSAHRGRRGSDEMGGPPEHRRK